jgi:hypothetical protein
MQQPTESFRFTFTDPYDTFTEGKPQPIPYVIAGLCTQGGLSALGGKSKFGKSSLARYESVCVSKGLPCLGRDTVQGEVILINLEDPKNHVDNCLKVLEYNPRKDGRIRVVQRLAPTVEDNIEALGDALTRFPDVRFVVIDTLAKFIRVDDMNDYMTVLDATEKIHDLARKFPHLHIQATAHCKKIRTEDPFDGLLGSTALRAEPDTNIAIYGELNQKLIAAETRIGRHIPPTIIRGELELFADAEVVKNFILDKPFAEWQTAQSDRANHKTKVGHEERIIACLRENGGSAKQSLVTSEVEGKASLKLEAIEALKSSGVLTVTGEKQSPTNPTVLHLNPAHLATHSFINRFEGSVQ